MTQTLEAPATAAAKALPPKKVGFLSITGGINTSSVISVFALAYLANFGFAAMAQLNPYVLHSQLGLAGNVQGSVTGLLTSMQELVVILTSSLAGVYADRFGRRIVLLVGGVLLSIGFLGVMLANSLPELIASRAVFALGIAAIATTLLIFNGDYPTDATRGRWIGTIGFLQASGSFTAAMTVTQLPALFEREFGAGFAGSLTFLSCSLIGLVIICVAIWGVRPKDDFRGRGVPRATLQHLADGFKEARRPQVALGYLASVVSKADLISVNGFLFLWTVRYAADQGMSMSEGYGSGRALTASIQIAFICSVPFMGMLLDRLDRTVGVALCFAAATVTYLSMGFVDDPTESSVMIRGVFLGITEGAAIVSAAVLIAQQTSATNRGVIMGTFSTCGALGMLLGAAAAGYLFDHWRYSAPYLLMGIVNGCVALCALGVWARHRRRALVFTINENRLEEVPPSIDS